MKCPRCDTSTLDERDREGVVVDVCSQCRGLWLDRGELEKLIARAARDLDELEQQRAPERSPQSVDYAAPRSRRDSDHDYHYRHRRKKSFIESLGDIFD
ncbi:MAG TPA: zf-TFIIB domain-containing protein [Polyangiales bacterium]|nr:zf-TFIIB domain-containing protein [Polyangiales bacterium]